MKQAHRFSGTGKPYEGLTEIGPHGPRWTGKIRLVPELLDQPLHWKKPRRVFVNSMSDLFHEEVPDEFIDAVFGIMAASPRHTYQILTKRPARMLAWFKRLDEQVDCIVRAQEDFKSPRPRSQWYLTQTIGRAEQMIGREDIVPFEQEEWIPLPWPLPNVWLGVSCEDQATADARIPLLFMTPAAVRWISAEPLLGPVDLAKHFYLSNERFNGRTFQDDSSFPELAIDWVVVGGESGPRSRPCDLAWIRSLKDQCQAVKVRCFVKQLGARPLLTGKHDLGSLKRDFDHVDGEHRSDLGGFILHYREKKGGDPAEWPEDLRIREFPR